MDPQSPLCESLKTLMSLNHPYRVQSYSSYIYFVYVFFLFNDSVYPHRLAKFLHGNYVARLCISKPIMAQGVFNFHSQNSTIT